VLPGLTVAEAAAGRSTLVATIIGVAVGAVVLVPSLAVLYSLVLRGRLDTAVVPDSAAAAGSGGAAAGSDEGPGAVGRRSLRVSRGRLAAGFAVVTLVAGIGLLVFAEPAWANGLGAVALIACAVTVFALASRPAAELRVGRPRRQRWRARLAAGPVSIRSGLWLDTKGGRCDGDRPG
jgi:cytochrome d ubiquinol oxidase subunit II